MRAKAGTWTLARKLHLKRLVDEAARRIDHKYKRGQAEHGGNLWEKRGLLSYALDEAVDQLVYLLTLAEQHPELLEGDDYED